MKIRQTLEQIAQDASVIAKTAREALAQLDGQPVDVSDPRISSRTKRRTSAEFSAKTPPALIQIGEKLYSGTTEIKGKL